VPAIATPATELRSQRAAAFQRRGAKPADDDDQYTPDERFQERVVQVRRVTKVVKGGKQLSFRAVVSAARAATAA
jgi:small subunit ribosomal protein S5